MIVGQYVQDPAFTQGDLPSIIQTTMELSFHILQGFIADLTIPLQ